MATITSNLYKLDEFLFKKAIVTVNLDILIEKLDLKSLFFNI